MTALKSLWISSDQDLMIETNSGSAPDDTIHVIGGNPIWWDAARGAEDPAPLTADVTQIFVTNAGSTAAVLRILGLQDATP